jgi:hypothetical protein
VREITTVCNLSMATVQEACNLGEFNQREREIEELFNSFNLEKTNRDNIFRSRAPDNTASIAEIIRRLEVLHTYLTNKTNELAVLKNTCQQRRDESVNNCVRPVIQVQDINPVEKSEGNAIAGARLASDVPLRVETGSTNSDLVDTTRAITLRTHGEANGQAGRTIETAELNREQITQTIRALQDIINPNNPVCETSGLLASADCDPPEPPVPPEPDPVPPVCDPARRVAGCTPPPVPPEPNPPIPPVDEPPRVVGSFMQDCNTCTRYSDGTVRCTEMMCSGYGPSGPGNPSGGGLNSGLNSLGGMFGKTGGGFGSEGYRTSGNSRLSNSQNSGSRSNPGYAIPNDNIDYTRTGNANTRTPNPQSRAFNSNSSNAGGNGFNGAAGAGQGSNAGGNNGAGGSKAGSKQSLFSRLFGKKKDKTMFGKTDNSAGGGRFASTSKTSGEQNLNPGAASDARLNDQGRTFDASKYAPSAKAQARAHARATGRRIASKASSAAFEWPSDISKNKKENIFKKVNLPHRINLQIQ